MTRIVSQKRQVTWPLYIHQGLKNVFESGRLFGHVEERLVAKLPLVSRSEIPEVNKSLISLLRLLPRLSCLTFTQDLTRNLQ